MVRDDSGGFAGTRFSGVTVLLCWITIALLTALVVRLGSTPVVEAAQQPPEPNHEVTGVRLLRAETAFEIPRTTPPAALEPITLCDEAQRAACYAFCQSLPAPPSSNPRMRNVFFDVYCQIAPNIECKCLWSVVPAQRGGLRVHE